MRRLSLAALFVAGLAALAPAVADAFAIAMPMRPGKNRVAVTDAIVLGRVVGMEDMDVKVPLARGVDQKATYRIAVVNVAEVIKGKKDLKQIRVGFMPVGVPAVDGPQPQPQPRPIQPRPGFGPVHLQTGQE